MLQTPTGSHNLQARARRDKESIDQHWVQLTVILFQSNSKSLFHSGPYSWVARHDHQVWLEGSTDFQSKMHALIWQVDV
jgi:hypothetical protein